MIGKIYTAMFQFYNVKTQKMEFKHRPILVIDKPDNGDYNVLPISSVLISRNVNFRYDIKIDKENYALLNLSKDVSYIRTSKPTTLHYKVFDKEISNLKELYPELFELVIDRFTEYANTIKAIAILKEKG